MFAWTEKYTESDLLYNNDLLYKTHQKHQNTLVFGDLGGEKSKQTII